MVRTTGLDHRYFRHQPGFSHAEACASSRWRARACDCALPRRLQQHPLPAYQLAKVSRGEAVTKVVAAGTVQPVVSVVVGSQVSGQVKEILVDHNDAVKEGQPIALLDPELFNTRVEQARAEVDVASDAVRIAKDEVTTAEAAVQQGDGRASQDGGGHQTLRGDA